MDWKLERCARYLYVLELENGKFYVGQAKDPDRRIRKHFNGMGSEWTRLHRPLKELSRLCLDDVDYREGERVENELVLQMMRQHGHDKVRGGFFSNTSVEHVEKNLISHGHRSVISGSISPLDTKELQAPSAQTTQQISHQVLIGADYGLFVLKLEDEHYFVGYSTKPDVRIKRHFEDSIRSLSENPSLPVRRAPAPLLTRLQKCRQPRKTACQTTAPC